MRKLIYFYLLLKDFLQKRASVLIFAFIVLLLFARSLVFLDPDFGWRLKGGELFLSSGVAKTDPFSYTMPSFPWVDHAWLQSVIMSFIFINYGKASLSFLYALMAVAALLVSLRRNEKTVKQSLKQITKDFTDWNLGPFGSVGFILSAYLVWFFYGIRAQVVSWLMISLIFNLLLDLKVWSKWRKFTPALFLVWANLHGSFFLGLCVMATVLGIRNIRQKKFDLSDFLIFVSCVLLTFLNPYGAGVWREAWSSISDAGLRWSIIEWMPAVAMFNLPFAFFAAFSLALIVKQIKFFKPEELVLYLLFLLAATSSRRNLPLWAILTFPLVDRAICHFYKNLSKIKEAVSRFRKAYKIVWIVVSCAILVQMVLDSREIFLFKEGRYYPKQAVSYLKENLPAGKIFSEYGWGGYLIWKLPEKKVFIDGRMPSWRWSPPNNLELSSAFDTYSGVLKGEQDYEEIFDKYQIDTVLWSREKKKSFLDLLSEKVLNFLGKENFDFLGKLDKDGWEKVYEDGVAVIYIQKSS